MSRSRVFSLFAALLIQSNVKAETNPTSQNIKFVTFPQFPYQIESAGAISGRSIDTLNCIFKKLDKKHSIDVVPRKRGLAMLFTGEAQAIFTFTKSEELEPVAVFSNPLFLEKWYWFSHKESSFNPSKLTKNSTIGAVMGSNEENWLRKTYPQIEVKPINRMNQLFDLVKAKRINAFLATLDQVENFASDNKVDINQLEKTFQKYIPLGVYFKKNFADQDFLNNFNSKIKECSSERITLNNDERTVLIKTAEDIKKWSKHALILEMIKKQNQKFADISQTKIKELDATWLQEVKKGGGKVTEGILSNELSAFLKKIKEDSNHLYAEIFVMDNHGLNVGQSDLTSDYWQGDEAKFINVAKNKDEIFIDEIEYDESSGRFQSQISLNILDKNGSVFIGSITVGVDVEYALQRSSE